MFFKRVSFQPTKFDERIDNHAIYHILILRFNGYCLYQKTRKECAVVQVRCDLLIPFVGKDF